MLMSRGFPASAGGSIAAPADYQTRISGPLMDRIDLRIEVPAVSAADLILPPPAEGSAEVAARVAAARDIQTQRATSHAGHATHVRTNAEAPASVLEAIAQPDAQGLQKLLRDAVRNHEAFLPAAITACCASRERWPISMVRRQNRPAAPGRSAVVSGIGGRFAACGLSGFGRSRQGSIGSEANR